MAAPAAGQPPVLADDAVSLLEEASVRVGAGARSALTAYRSDTSVVPGTLVPLPNVAALREGVRAFLPAFRVAPPDVQRGHKGLYGFLCAASSEDAGGYPQYFGRDANGLPTGEWHASRALGVSSSFLASVRSFYDADADYRAGVGAPPSADDLPPPALPGVGGEPAAGPVAAVRGPVCVLRDLLAAIPPTASADEQLQLVDSTLAALRGSGVGGAARRAVAVPPSSGVLGQPGAVPAAGVGAVALPAVPKAPLLKVFLPGLDPRKESRLRMVTAPDGSLSFTADSSGSPSALQLPEFLQCSYAALQFYYEPHGVADEYSAHIMNMIDLFKGPFTAHQLTLYDQAHRQAWEENKATFDLAQPNNGLFHKHLIATSLAGLSSKPAPGPRSSPASLPASSGGGGGRQGGSAASGVKRPRAAEPCWLFARGKCASGGCPEARVHACKTCDKAYPLAGACPAGHTGDACGPTRASAAPKQR